MNIGPPRSAVKMPMGIWPMGWPRFVAVILARIEMLSARMSSAAPMIAAVGMSILCAGENVFLAMCGQMNPTKPMGPARPTAAAVKRPAMRKRMSLSLGTLTPMDAACESENVTRSIAFAMVSVMMSVRSAMAMVA